MRQLRFSARDVAGSELHFGLERGLALRRGTANRRQHHAPRRGQRRLHLQASECVLSHSSITGLAGAARAEAMAAAASSGALALAGELCALCQVRLAVD
jgi:hypothetical protein